MAAEFFLEFDSWSAQRKATLLSGSGKGNLPWQRVRERLRSGLLSSISDTSPLDPEKWSTTVWQQFSDPRSADDPVARKARAALSAFHHLAQAAAISINANENWPEHLTPHLLAAQQNFAQVWQTAGDSLQQRPPLPSESPARPTSSLANIVGSLIDANPSCAEHWLSVIALDDLMPGLLEKVAGKLISDVRLPALMIQMDDSAGRLVELHLKRFRNRSEAAPPMLLADPVPLGCTVIGESFLDSVATAWQYVHGLPTPASRGMFRHGDIVIWRLLGIDGAAVVTGPSLGATFACGLLGLARGIGLDAVPIPVCASVNIDGTLGRHGGWQDGPRRVSPRSFQEDHPVEGDGSSLSRSTACRIRRRNSGHPC